MTVSCRNGILFGIINRKKAWIAMLSFICLIFHALLFAALAALLSKKVRIKVEGKQDAGK